MHASVKERGIIQRKQDAQMSNKITLHAKNQMKKIFHADLRGQPQACLR